MIKILEFFYQVTSLQVTLGQSNLFQKSEWDLLVKDLTQIA